jgi:hypothetical protein
MLARGLFLMVVATACSTDFMIDSRLKTHVDKFYSLSDGDLQRDNLIVMRRNGLLKETGAIGRAIIDHGFLDLWDGQITVQIDKEYCETSDYLVVETSVFHELGHALLNRDHADQIPSIMSTTGEYSGYRYNPKDSDTYDSGLHVRLIKELFHP